MKLVPASSSRRASVRGLKRERARDLGLRRHARGQAIADALPHLRDRVIAVEPRQIVERDALGRRRDLGVAGRERARPILARAQQAHLRRAPHDRGAEPRVERCDVGRLLADERDLERRERLAADQPGELDRASGEPVVEPVGPARRSPEPEHVGDPHVLGALLESRRPHLGHHARVPDEPAKGLPERGARKPRVTERMRSGSVHLPRYVDAEGRVAYGLLGGLHRAAAQCARCTRLPGMPSVAGSTPAARKIGAGSILPRLERAPQVDGRRQQRGAAVCRRAETIHLRAWPLGTSIWRLRSRPEVTCGRIFAR